MPSDKGRHFVMARCECGVLWEGYKYSLLRGLTKSCGCDWRQPKHGEGAKRTPEYTTWQGMRNRCTNPKYIGYALYGGRGIRICPEWSEFAAFLDDMGRRPSPQHSLDRIDSNGNYTPQNVRWATATEQSRNTRRNRWITINEETLLFSDWCQRAGIRPTLAYKRIKHHGWSVERAITTPSRKIMESPLARIEYASTREVPTCLP